ncbi:MAG: response regulator [Deltaproteobacteria bacterium]|nr:response regulator [Deltaproteobacteria bacterium]
MTLNKRILLIDDDADFNMIIRRYLEKQGFEVESAYNGKQGLEKVYDNPPDLILLDVMMPEMDGYKVCSELKNDKNYDEIPIILLTSVGDNVTSGEVEKPPTRYSHQGGRSVVADDFLSKPSSAEEITKSVRRLLDV